MIAKPMPEHLSVACKCLAALRTTNDARRPRTFTRGRHTQNFRFVLFSLGNAWDTSCRRFRHPGLAEEAPFVARHHFSINFVVSLVVMPEGRPTVDLLLTRGTLELRRETFPQLSVEHILLFVNVAQMLAQFGIILVGVTAAGVRADKGSVQPFQTFQCRRLRGGFDRSSF